VINWKRLLAYITGSVDPELLLRNEYLAPENRVLKHQIKGRLRRTDPERTSLAEIGKRLDRRALEDVAQIVRPETSLGWHRRLIAHKFDGSKNRSCVTHAWPHKMLEDWVLQFAKENPSWGYRRIVGARSNLGHQVSYQTVANMLKRHGLAPAPERRKQTTWRDFIRSHTEVLGAVDFFTAEV
jgi:putative transposase